MDVTVWRQELIDVLRGHMDTERGALTRYRQLADEAPDDHVRFLMQLILDDEIRHHQLFDEMVNRLRREGEHRGPEGLPRLRASADREVLRRETKDLLDIERDDIKELRQLRKQIQKVADTEWWSVLIDIMEADNRKHIGILEFVRDNA